MDDPVPRLTGTADQPQSDPPDQHRSHASRSRDRKGRREPASANQLRAALEMLSGMLLLGQISERKAVALTRIWELLLRHASAVAGAGGIEEIDPRALRDVFRNHPEVADVFAPFLSRELLDELLRGDEELE